MVSEEQASSRLQIAFVASCPSFRCAVMWLCLSAHTGGIQLRAHFIITPDDVQEDEKLVFLRWSEKSPSKVAFLPLPSELCRGTQIVYKAVSKMLLKINT